MDISSLWYANQPSTVVGTTSSGGIDIDGGAKIENLTLADSVINASGGKSCVIGISETSAIVTMDNCVVNGPRYVVYASAPIDAFTAVDCEFKNISSWAFMFNAGDAVGMNLTINGCSFENCTDGIAKKLSAQHADATTVFTNNTLTGSAGHDGKDSAWFALNTAANTVSGNTLDGAEWIPGAAQGLGA